jgi:hypothetical protein
LARGRTALLVSGLSLLLLADVFVSGARAATRLGNTSASATSCNIDDTFRLQKGVATGSSPYAAPSDGVITSWQTYALSGPSQQLRFKVFRPTATPGQYVVVGESSVETLTPSSLNSFDVRIPVRAGDLIGQYQPLLSVVGCVFAASGEDQFDFGTGDPAVGSTGTGSGPGSGYTLNESATLEPDADHDDFGDETQDQCPTEASTHGACPAAPATSGAPPPASPDAPPPANPGAPLPASPVAPLPATPAPFGGIQIASLTVTVKSGRVTVIVSCPATAVGNCVGTDTLTTASKVIAPRLVAAKKSAKILKLGTAKFSIASGARGKVTIKLNKTALKLLAKKSTLKASQTIVAHDSRNASKKSTGQLKLKLAAKNKHQ